MTVGRDQLRPVSAQLLRLGLAGSLLVTSIVLTTPIQQPVRAACGPGGQWVGVRGLPDSCVHEDEPPAGVDVTEPVSTTELWDRLGAGETAYAVAEDLGVPAVQVASNATSPAVTCDGDGTSGYRVQPMYVVEAGHANRYADLQANLRLWAAGVDDVINRSAALTGGVRRVRFVTASDGAGGCVASVLNVTVPNGAMSSFSATITAVQALGYTSPTRKYLMWTDATALCGIAGMYPTDTDGQANPNNGSYAQYARIDSGCWGFGNGAAQHSVEAHELLHTLGGVQNTAPHSTQAGHCWDESDSMCYADGGNHAMVQVCPVERESFFDCNSDDYFSTFPDPGGYLDTHWNAADSRFLIGGGDGSGGGQAGAPTVLGATISVNNPAVPGLSTQVSVAPALPTGRTLTSVSWKSARADCAFSTPTDLQSLVTCSATGATATTVTATLVDSTGATKSVTSPLTFAGGTARPVVLSLAAATQSTSNGSTASVCTGAGFPLVGTALDQASGAPVKGLSVSFTRKTAAMLAPSTAGSAATSLAGTSTLTQTATVATAYTAKTVGGTFYAAATSPTLTAQPTQCSPALTAVASTAATYYADPVTVSGTLTRSVGGATVPVSGASLPVRLIAVLAGVTKVTVLGTARTLADGSYSLVVKPTASGTLNVLLAGSASYVTTNDDAGPLTVTVPQTDLSAGVNTTTVAYGSTITVTGFLHRVAGATVTNLSGKSVGVWVTKTGTTTPTKIGSGTVTAAGTYSIAVPLKLSGALVAKYDGAAGQPTATVALGNVTAATWATALTASAAPQTLLLGGSSTVTGTLSRSYAGSTVAAPGIRVSVRCQPTGSSVWTTLASSTTTTTGAFTIRTYPRVSSTCQAFVSAVPGYADATSSTWAVTVT